jgi:hypothetical protein
MVSNIIHPFIECETPEQAKDLLDSMKGSNLSANAHKALFKKVVSISKEFIYTLGYIE